MVRALSSSEYPTMAWKDFQIYGVQITGKCIFETHPLPPPPSSWHDLIISPPWRTHPSPDEFPPKSVSPHEKLLFGKKSPHFLGEKTPLQLHQMLFANLSAGQLIDFKIKANGLFKTYDQSAASWFYFKPPHLPPTSISLFEQNNFHA